MKDQNRKQNPSFDSNETVTETQIREALNYAGVKVDPEGWYIERLQKLRDEQQEFIDQIAKKGIE